LNLEKPWLAGYVSILIAFEQQTLAQTQRKKTLSASFVPRHLAAKVRSGRVSKRHLSNNCFEEIGCCAPLTLPQMQTNAASAKCENPTAVLSRSIPVHA
jgi:hypothetical protein